MDQRPIRQNHPRHLPQAVVLWHQFRETTKMLSLLVLTPSQRNRIGKEAFKKPGYLARFHPMFVRLVWKRNIRNKAVWRWTFTCNTFTRLLRLASSFICSLLPHSKQPQYWLHLLYDIGGSTISNLATILACSNIYWYTVCFRFRPVSLVLPRP